MSIKTLLLLCKRCVNSKQALRYFMFEITLFFFFWSILRSRLADINVNEFIQLGPSPPYGQEFTKVRSK